MDEELARRLSTPEGLKSWYEETDAVVMARATLWPAGFAGQYRVCDGGYYVSEPDMDEVIPDEHLRCLYVGLANTLGCDDLPSRGEAERDFAAALPDDLVPAFERLDLSPEAVEDTKATDEYRAFDHALKRSSSALWGAFLSLPLYGIDDVCRLVCDEEWVADFTSSTESGDEPVFYTECEGPEEFTDEELFETAAAHPEYFTEEHFSDAQAARYIGGDPSVPLDPRDEILHGFWKECCRDAQLGLHAWTRKQVDADPTCFSDRTAASAALACDYCSEYIYIDELREACRDLLAGARVPITRENVATFVANAAKSHAHADFGLLLERKEFIKRACTDVKTGKINDYVPVVGGREGGATPGGLDGLAQDAGKTAAALDAPRPEDRRPGRGRQ